ncbi:MAG: leucine-rich repeat domain-containing protein [Candidatus Thorarchaeota archaeon]
MNEHLTPKKIYDGVIAGEISRKLAQSQLISLIEGSNLPKWRSKAIVIVKQLNFRELEIYKVIENALLSDESAMVRNSAVELICADFFNEGLKSLIWVLEHEQSPLVLNTIYKSIRWNPSNSKERLYNAYRQIFLNIGNSIGIDISEVPFILELESIFAKNYDNYNIELKSYLYFKQLRDSIWHDPWLEIQDNHIISLTLNFLNWNYIKNNLERIESILKMEHLYLYLEALRNFNIIKPQIFKIPKSIENLTFLKTLDLSNNGLLKMPDNIGKLLQLEKLFLANNKLSTIPKAIFTLPSLKVLDIRDNELLNLENNLSYLTNTLKIYRS